MLETKKTISETEAVDDTAAHSDIKAPERQMVMPGAGAKVIKLARELIDLIESENVILEGARPRDAAKMQGTKTRVMTEYKEAIGQLQLNQHLLGDEDSDIRKQIRASADDLKDCLAIHARIILRRKSVADGLITRISEEANKSSRDIPAYGSTAAKASSSSRPTSIALNQVI